MIELLVLRLYDTKTFLAFSSHNILDFSKLEWIQLFCWLRSKLIRVVVLLCVCRYLEQLHMVSNMNQCKLKGKNGKNKNIWRKKEKPIYIIVDFDFLRHMWFDGQHSYIRIYTFNKRYLFNDFQRNRTFSST